MLSNYPSIQKDLILIIWGKLISDFEIFRKNKLKFLNIGNMPASIPTDWISNLPDLKQKILEPYNGMLYAV